MYQKEETLREIYAQMNRLARDGNFIALDDIFLLAMTEQFDYYTNPETYIFGLALLTSVFMAKGHLKNYVPYGEKYRNKMIELKGEEYAKKMLAGLL